MLIHALRAVASKPAQVVAFRARQHITLWWMGKAGRWQAISKRLQAQLRARDRDLAQRILLSPGPLSPGQSKHLLALASAVRSSRFKIFGSDIPSLEMYDFATDWRFQKHWPGQYFKRYRFYETRSTPYDVKFPWELSRLAYLVTALAAESTAEPEVGRLHWITGVLTRWRAANPLAHSVNWNPMEASVRTVSLTMLLDLARAVELRVGARDAELGRAARELEDQLILMIAEHGSFVWRALEFTDGRGNHFAANLVALLLAGLVLEGVVPEARRWRRYADRALDREIAAQFLPDGVNFEKSCGYHKLVLELFAIAAVARWRAGVPLAPASLARLAAAARFSDALMRPNGTGAAFGDTDDAVVLPFTLQQPSSHAPIVGTLRALLKQDIGQLVIAETEWLPALFLVGETRAPCASSEPASEVLTFPSGGYVIVRSRKTGFFLMVDVGEVGQGGRGGHGHNDLLSFELCVAGQLIVVDPGCPCYTGDAAKHLDYRRTGRHSTIELFGQEMARMSGHWRIEDDARPVGVEVVGTANAVRIAAGHTGYERIAPGTRIMRQWTVNADEQCVDIEDEIIVSAPHARARWAFPFGSADARQTGERRIEIAHAACLVSEDGPVLNLQETQMSAGYGREEGNRTAVAEQTLRTGRHRFRWRITALGEPLKDASAKPSSAAAAIQRPESSSTGILQ